MRQQERSQIHIPVWSEPELMGLIYAWAKGTSWNDLISNTSLDEGDVVRIIRRTIDLLSQIKYCESISGHLKDNAKLAVKAINRFPVCESDDILNELAEGKEVFNPATQRIN